MSSTGAPEDLDPAYVAESNLPRIIGVSSVLFFLATLFVGLRMYVRLRIVRSVGRDDWTMAACLVRGILRLVDPNGCIANHQDLDIHL